MAPAREVAVVRCPDCGGTREISIRQRRRIKNGDRSLLCSLCRTIPHPAEVTQDDRDFWTESYSMEWIMETADWIWGEH